MRKAVSLHEFDPWMILVCIIPNRIVDMPDQQATSRQEFIETRKLAVLDQEVLLGSIIAVDPKSVYLVMIFDIRQCDLSILCFDDGINPALLSFAPCIELASS